VGIVRAKRNAKKKVAEKLIKKKKKKKKKAKLPLFFRGFGVLFFPPFPLFPLPPFPPGPATLLGTEPDTDATYIACKWLQFLYFFNN
jgi:hypothetical protein